MTSFALSRGLGMKLTNKEVTSEGPPYSLLPEGSGNTAHDAASPGFVARLENNGYPARLRTAGSPRRLAVLLTALVIAGTGGWTYLQSEKMLPSSTRQASASHPPRFALVAAPPHSPHVKALPPAIRTQAEAAASKNHFWISPEFEWLTLGDRAGKAGDFPGRADDGNESLWRDWNLSVDSFASLAEEDGHLLAAMHAVHAASGDTVNGKDDRAVALLEMLMRHLNEKNKSKK